MSKADSEHKNFLKRDEVNFAELKSGIKGVALGEEDWFLLVKKNGKWRFSLWNLMPYEALTGWISLITPEDLRASRKAKIIRDKVKARWGNASEIIEWIVIEIRYNKTEFSGTGKADEKEAKGQSQACQLVQLCLDQEPVLFHDQTKTAYTRIKQNAITVTLPIRSRHFKAWLANLLWKAEKKAPGTEALSSAINILEAMALFDGPEYMLYNRVAPADDGVWIDMADDKWRAIKVTPRGWQIIDDPPILFKRYSHQRPLVEPKAGGDPWKFLDFVNVDEKDEDTRLILLSDTITFLIPEIPHVLTVLYGIQGSGKTMLLKLIRRLIDPSAVEVLSLPRDERERVQQLDHHWCAFYDNVTSLPYWISDTLCRATTGGGFTKRELYTDDQDIIYSFKRCVGLSGINIAAQRGDLLDRSLLVELKDIPKEKRKTEEKLLAEFESCKAEILGGFLDTLVKAIRAYPSVNLKELFRMADFTKWGCAIAIALGKTQEDFIKAYETKVKMQIEEAAHASPIATVLIDHMESLEKWDGTPSQLYIALNNHAKTLNISTRQKAWPKAPNALVRRLNELAPSLESLGWKLETGIKSGSTRRICISIVPTVPKTNGEKPLKDDRDNRDGILYTSSGPIMVSVKDWCRTYRNERSEIDLEALAKFIKEELKQEPQRVVREAFNQEILSRSPTLGKAVVI